MLGVDTMDMEARRIRALKESDHDPVKTKEWASGQ